MAIKTYSTTPASNTALFPENMNPSAVNDGMRQVQADIRAWYIDAEWADRGDTPSRASNTSFKIATDVTGTYHAGRRLKLYDTSTIYAVIASSSYSNPDTTINVTTDSGNLSSSLSSVAVGILSATNPSIPNETNKTYTGNLTIGGTSSLSGAAVFKTTATIEGAATISGAAVFKTTATVEGNATFGGTATISGAAVFKTTTTFEGEATFSASIVAKGTLKLDSANIHRKGADIASAGTTDLSAATGDFVDVTGTTTITALGTVTAGVERVVRFTGALTLTHNGTSLILPGAANITTAANDRATFRSLGSGNWICIDYTKADGTPIVGGSQDWVLISTATASASSAINFTGLSSTYYAYKIVITNLVPATDNTSLYFLTSTNGGSSYDAGASDYAWVRRVNALTTTTSISSTGDDADAQIVIVNAVGNSTNETLNAEVVLFNPSGTTFFRIATTVIYKASDAVEYFVQTAGVRASAADVDAVRFIMNSGNITSGTFKLYGLKA